MLNFKGKKDVYCLVLDNINRSGGSRVYLPYEALLQDRDALLEARTKRFRQTSEGDSVMNEQK